MMTQCHIVCLRLKQNVLKTKVLIQIQIRGRSLPVFGGSLPFLGERGSLPVCGRSLQEKLASLWGKLASLWGKLASLQGSFPLPGTCVMKLFSLADKSQPTLVWWAQS